MRVPLFLQTDIFEYQVNHEDFLAADYILRCSFLQLPSFRHERKRGLPLLCLEVCYPLSFKMSQPGGFRRVQEDWQIPLLSLFGMLILPE